MIIECKDVGIEDEEAHGASGSSSSFRRYSSIATEGDAACSCKIASLPSAWFQNVSVPCTPWFNSNSHREVAKNAKKVRELVHCLFPSRSWRLRGERLNLLDLFGASAIVLVRIVRPQTTLIVG